MTKVIYKFDLVDDRDDLIAIQNIDRMYFALDEIYNLARQQLKYGKSLGEEGDWLLTEIQNVACLIHKLEE